MNGHLIMLHTTEYSFPLAIFATYEGASACRKRVGADPKAAFGAVDLDTMPAVPGEFLSVSIVSFEGGRPIEEDTYDLN